MLARLDAKAVVQGSCCRLMAHAEKLGSWYVTTYKSLMTDAEIESLIERTPFATGTARAAFAVSNDASVIVKK